MRILTVVGARPQFVKAAVVSRALKQAGVDEVLVHTGQHYDPNLSRVFFDELGIPEPDHHLGVGSGSHARQTADMMTGIEHVLQSEPPVVWMLVYGDTNSTLAGALVAAKLHVPIAHVEAGLRSFDRRMPEEVNRVVTDSIATLLFCPTSTSVENLVREGITKGVLLTGDVMLDATRLFAERAAADMPLDRIVGHAPESYCVATVHRAGNTDDPVRLAGILEALGRIPMPVVLPMHPRTRARLPESGLPGNVEAIAPVGYLAMLSLVRNAHRVLTDSGGLQKEAVWLGTPCITLRDETEWVETLQNGWNRVAGADADAILSAYAARPDGPPPAAEGAGEQSASRAIAASLLAGP